MAVEVETVETLTTDAVVTTVGVAVAVPATK
jgi:hypothetical protein